MQLFVAYYRISTDKQGVTGLGMEAQRDAVTSYVRSRGTIVAEYTEVESGKKHKNRPQLIAAIAECRRRRAMLVIAKLDRLARNVHFISGLMNSNVEFVAVDDCTASRLTIHILAAVADIREKMISQRTKAQENGERYCEVTANNAAAAAERGKRSRASGPSPVMLVRPAPIKCSQTSPPPSATTVLDGPPKINPRCS